MKANYSRPGDEIPLRCHEDEFVRQDQPGGIFRHIAKRSAETAFLDALDARTKQGRPVNSTRNQANYARKVMARMLQTEGFRMWDLERAMERLFNTGEIRVEESGAGKRNRIQIVRVQKDEST